MEANPSKMVTTMEALEEEVAVMTPEVKVEKEPTGSQAIGVKEENEEMVSHKEKETCGVPEGASSPTTETVDDASEPKATNVESDGGEPISVFPPPTPATPNSVFPPPTATTPDSIFPPPTASHY